MTDPADILAGYHRTGQKDASTAMVPPPVAAPPPVPPPPQGRPNQAAARRQAAVDRVVETARRYVLVDRAMTLDPQAVTSDMVKDINDQLERLHAAVDALEEVDRGR